MSGSLSTFHFPFAEPCIGYVVPGVALLATMEVWLQTPTISSREKINMAQAAKTGYAQRQQFQMNSHKQAKERIDFLHSATSTQS